MSASEFFHQIIDNGRNVPGATATFRQGSRPGPVFLDPELRTPARNPFLTKSDGIIHVYLNAGETYEVTIETPRGRRWQFTHVAKAPGKTSVREVEVRVEVEKQVPVEVERIVTVQDPRQAAEIERLQAEIEALKSRTAPVPEELGDLIDWSAPPRARQEALLAKWREINGLIQLSEDRGTRASADLYHKRDRIESGMTFNRPTLAETT